MSISRKVTPSFGAITACHSRPAFQAVRPSFPAPIATAGAGVVAVAVGADFVGELLSDRGAADHHLGLAANARLLQGVDDRLHHGHGGGQQGGEGDDGAVLLLGRFDEFLRRHVNAQIDHFEPAAFEHRGHQVLADVVQVALHGADDDAAGRLGPGFTRSGVISSSEVFIARAAISSSGTKYSLHSNRLPTSSMAGIMYFCTSSPDRPWPPWPPW